MLHIGILGGTFDPIHLGHIKIAESAAREAKLTHVLLVPAGRPPHRPVTASADDRMLMTVKAAAYGENLSACPLDMTNKKSYTVRVIRKLHALYPDARLSCIIGADKLSTLQDWYKAEELFSLCDFLVCPRGDVDADAASAKARALGAKFVFLKTAPLPISSGLVRERLAALDDAHDILPPAVCAYIAKKGLYREDDLQKLRASMTEKRFAHTLGVRDTAVALAYQYGADMQRAGVAALYHDCAKCMPLAEAQKIAMDNHLVSEPLYLESSALLHAAVGAYVCEHTYGITDAQVLQAIRRHTTGSEEMTLLDLCVFIADAIEPGREQYPELDNIRALAKESLYKAALLSMRATREHVKMQGKPYAEDTTRALLWMEKAVQNEEQNKK